ncbi:LHFPL tetraspan subfamily member 7 protein isoform X1 [Phyllobates terribilis]|uniref:LHFPL tetraspan subfamily member 7 protein isoform X1 n=1 Tax=Phyllobates terribilis TaxID=111132 RepID=UPI003CCB1857
MVSCMGSLWVALSFILSLILGFSLMSSAWFKNNNTSFGVFVQCEGKTSNPCNQTCTAFRTLEEIPDMSWKISAVILFAGWLLLSFGALLVLSWTVIPAGLCQRRVCTPARHTQIIAGPKIWWCEQALRLHSSRLVRVYMLTPVYYQSGGYNSWSSPVSRQSSLYICKSDLQLILVLQERQLLTWLGLYDGHYYSNALLLSSHHRLLQHK